MGTFGTLDLGLGLTIRNRRNGGAPSIQWEEWVDGLTEAQVLDIDFGQTDRHFQEATGVTLADDAGESIGLALDSGAWGGRTLAQELAGQAELVTNGDFTTDVSGWNISAGGSLTWDAGKARMENVSARANASQSISLTANLMYFLAGEVETVSGVIAKLMAGSSPGGNQYAGSTSTAFVPQYFTPSGSPVVVSLRGGDASAGSVSKMDNISLKRTPGNAGSQASAPLQGKRQAGGVCRYDGLDDTHLTTFFAQAGPMTLLYHGTVAVSLAATQMVLGASGSGADRCWLAITTNGFIAAGVGSEGAATIVGTTDVRGKTIVAALTFDGTAVKLFLRVDGVTTEEYSAAQAGTPTTTIPFRTGAYNNNGTAAGWAAVDAKRLSAAHKSMALAEFTSIAAAWAA